MPASLCIQLPFATSKRERPLWKPWQKMMVSKERESEGEKEGRREEERERGREGEKE